MNESIQTGCLPCMPSVTTDYHNCLITIAKAIKTMDIVMAKEQKDRLDLRASGLFSTIRTTSFDTVRVEERASCSRSEGASRKLYLAGKCLIFAVLLHNMRSM